MNPQRQLEITMGYRFKYIALGIVTYVAVQLMVIAISLKVLVQNVM
ncbi:3016_t:CDS:2, partial [Funneliformis geosporum]